MLGWGNVPTHALAIALAADTVSTAVMELVGNGVVAVTPGAMEVQLHATRTRSSRPVHRH